MAVRKLTETEYQAWLEKKQSQPAQSRGGVRPLTQAEYEVWLAKKGGGSGRALSLMQSQQVQIGTDIETQQPVTLPFEQRTRGCYVIGKTGVGKTTGLVSMALEDVRAGRGLIYLDWHGDAIDDILARMPPSRLSDVILFDPLDPEYTPGLHFFGCEDRTDLQQISRTLDSVLEVFAKLFTEEGTFSNAPNMELTLTNLTLLLIDNPGITMNEAPLILTPANKDLRTALMSRLSPDNFQIAWFWNYYNSLPTREQDAISKSTYSRMNRFLADPHIRHIVGQRATTLPFDRILEEGKILLVKLPPFQPNLSRLVGSVLIELLSTAVFARSKIDRQLRKPVCLFVDEFQNFATATFAELLAGVRKFNLAVTIAHQWRDQLNDANKGATLNAGNLIIYQVSGRDAEELVKQLQFTPVSLETRREAKLAISENPVEHLTKNGHSNPEISRYIKFVRRLTNMLARIDKEATMFKTAPRGGLFSDHGDHEYNREGIFKGIEQLNDYLVDMMHNRIVPGSLRHALSVTQICMQLRGYLGFVSQGEADSDPQTGHFRGYIEHELPASYRVPIAKFVYSLADAGQALLPSTEEVSEAPSLLEAIMEHNRGLLDKWMKPTAEEVEQAIRERSQDEYDAFVQAAYDLLELGNLLHDDPIQVTGGQWEETPIPRQYADMEREVAMSLANPAQPFSARVKVGTAEYVLQTNPLPAAAPEHAVTERIAAIREQNYRDGYTRRRNRVAKDLRKRHALLMQLVAEYSQQQENKQQAPPKQTKAQHTPPRAAQPAPEHQVRPAAGGEIPRQRSGPPPRRE